MILAKSAISTVPTSAVTGDVGLSPAAASYVTGFALTKVGTQVVIELPDVSTDDVLLYLALREAAHQRLFAGVPWLRDHLIGAVAEYGAGMDFDTSGMETKLREVDMTNPEAMQDALAGGLFDPEPSAAQNQNGLAVTRATAQELARIRASEGWRQHRMEAFDTEDGPVIVKTNRNHSGTPEKRLGRWRLAHRIVSGLERRAARGAGSRSW